MAKLALFFFIATVTLIQEVTAAPKEREQNVLTVTGMLKCGAKATNAKQTGLTLISKHTFSKDEKVVGAVQEEGKFQVTLVSTTKSLKPELIVYTGCSKGSSICKRKLRFAIPEGAVNNQAYSIGEVDLERLQVGEDRECSSNNVVAVTGTLKCNGNPATVKDTYLALLNVHDILPDEKLIAKVQEAGKFEVTMTTNSKSVHPEVNVFTECNKGNNKCKRKLRFAVPTDYVNLGSVYDLGEIDMEKPMVNEGRERECY